MGKLTISMAIFNSYVTNYQRVMRAAIPSKHLETSSGADAFYIFHRIFRGVLNRVDPDKTIDFNIENGLNGGFHSHGGIQNAWFIPWKISLYKRPCFWMIPQREPSLAVAVRSL
jgi:hypothetical protein